ncbi:hypothetical protein JCM12856_21990 [Spirochaeta dissipatitropha]
MPVWRLMVALLAVLMLPAVSTPASEDYAMDLSFSGKDWKVRDQRREVGPGPNIFSADNVKVQDDQLQLRILPRGQRRWTSAEIRTAEPVGYGEYTAVVRLPDTGIPDPLIFGFFTYDQDTAADHREIDIEFGRFGNTASDAPWLHFSLQPAEQPGRTIGFNPELPGGEWVISFLYLPERIDFYAFSPANAVSVYRFSVEGSQVPEPGQMHLHLNLWLFRGADPDRENFLRNPDDFLISIERVNLTPYSCTNED